MPERRRARLPGTIGPDEGKEFALTDDVIAARTTAPKRIFELTGSTAGFRSVSYAIKPGLAKKKIPRKELFSDLLRQQP